MPFLSVVNGWPSSDAAPCSTWPRASLRPSANFLRVHETDAFPASEFPARGSYDSLVVLPTRSGTTTEVVRLLEALRNRARTRTVVITADPDTPVVALADHRVVLDFADEKSVVQTRLPPPPWHCGGPGWVKISPLLSGQGRSALTAPLAPRTLDSSQFTFLGSGMSVGIANEAALKLREASQSWTESYPAMEFRHGPIMRSGELDGMGVRPASAGLLEDLDVTGAHVESSDLDAMADLIRAQRLAVALAEAKDSIPTSPGTWHGQSCSPDMTAMRRGTIRMSFNAILSLESTSAAPQSRPPSSIPTDSNTAGASGRHPGHLGPDAVVETTIHAIVEHKAQVPRPRGWALWALWSPGSWTRSEGSPSTPRTSAGSSSRAR